MKPRRVVFHADAEQDLAAIVEWIAERASPRTALNFVGRLRQYCADFDIFSERGARRDDLAPGLRTIGFRRRATIVFTLTSEDVIILRVLYCGRDIRRLFAPESELD